MSIRFVIAIAAVTFFVLVLGIDNLVAAKAAGHHGAQIYREYPGALDTQRPCPPSAQVWCRTTGGLAQ